MSPDHHPRQGRIIGGMVLIPGASSPGPGSVNWTGPTITSVTPGDPPCDATSSGDLTVDATGAWVLPGLIDLHGDAFERSIMPRPGVSIDLDLALADTTNQLLAAGITTAYLSATDSWEPGLRSRSMLRALIPAIDRANRAGRGPALLLHVRHERCNTSELDELIGWVGDGTIALVSFNDHTALDGDRARQVDHAQAQRAGLPGDALAVLAEAAVRQRPIGISQEERLAGAARAAGCPLASHDVATDDDLQRDLALGVTIAEFPTTMTTVDRYTALGITVVVGAPNLIRGRSHTGNLSVRELLGSGRPALLCSDYHYPSLLHAPFLLAELGILPFGQAWASASSGPAAAAGLSDRGRLVPGARADVVVVEPPDQRGPARLRAVVCAGKLVYHRPPSAGAAMAPQPAAPDRPEPPRR